MMPLLVTLAACNPATNPTDEKGDKAGGAPTPTPTAVPGPGPGPGPARSVRVTWNANREKTVNAAGGGYRVYYSINNNFNLSAAASVDVPYAGGATAPTAVTLPSLASGTWYIKVVAYSATNTTGNVSSQVTVSVP